MPLPRLVATEYVRRIETWARPFEGYAEDSDGRRVHVCIKAVLRNRPETPSALAAEMLGAYVADVIGVPVPRAVLVEVDQAFIAAAGGALDDVSPGIAFGSTWLEGSFPVAQGAAALSSVANPGSVAGVAVLDSLLRNGDRHANNALLVPAADAGTAFNLAFIDNGLGQAGAQEAVPIGLCVPRDGLANLVRDQESFHPYLLAVEGLDLDRVRDSAEAACALGWGIRQQYPEEVVTYLRVALGQIRPAILSGLHNFPNCR